MSTTPYEPAYPVVSEIMGHSSGMSLRDYFAAKVLQARMTAFCALETWHGWSEEEIAANAYAMADAMLAERNKE